MLEPDSDTEEEDGTNIEPETSAIYHTLDAEPKKRRRVLEHPLVQIFITLKWNRIRYLLGLGIVYHVQDRKIKISIILILRMITFSSGKV